MFDVKPYEKKEFKNRKTLLKTTFPFNFFLLILSRWTLLKFHPVQFLWEKKLKNQKHFFNPNFTLPEGEKCPFQLLIIVVCFSVSKDFWLAVIYRELILKSYSISPFVLHFIQLYTIHILFLSSFAYRRNLLCAFLTAMDLIFTIWSCSLIFESISLDFFFFLQKSFISEFLNSFLFTFAQRILVIHSIYLLDVFIINWSLENEWSKYPAKLLIVS